MKPTYYPATWDGQPVTFRIIEIIVADEPDDLKAQMEKGSSMKRYPWHIPFIGTTRQAVEVRSGNYTFFMDNADGLGLSKIRKGGGWRNGHRSIYPAEVLRTVPESEWIQFTPDKHKEVENQIDAGWTNLDPLGWPEMKKKLNSLLQTIKGGGQ